MGRWRRVVTPRACLVIAGSSITAGVVGLAVVLARMPLVGMSGMPFAGCLLLWIVLSGRMYRMGVYYGEYGVRSCMWLRTRTVPWDAVRAFEVRPARSRFWYGSLAPPRAIWIVCGDGTAIQTPVVYLSGEFHFDDGYQEGLAERQRAGWVWSRSDFQAALTQLRREQEKARRGLMRRAARVRRG